VFLDLFVCVQILVIESVMWYQYTLSEKRQVSDRDLSLMERLENWRVIEKWRDGEVDGWRDGETEGWKNGGMVDLEQGIWRDGELEM
jgi:hypothetical protein